MQQPNQTSSAQLIDMPAIINEFNRIHTIEIDNSMREWNLLNSQIETIRANKEKNDASLWPNDDARILSRLYAERNELSDREKNLKDSATLFGEITTDITKLQANIADLDEQELQSRLNILSSNIAIFNEEYAHLYIINAKKFEVIGGVLSLSVAVLAALAFFGVLTLASGGTLLPFAALIAMVIFTATLLAAIPISRKVIRNYAPNSMKGVMKDLEDQISIIQLNHPADPEKSADDKNRDVESHWADLEARMDKLEFLMKDEILLDKVKNKFPRIREILQNMKSKLENKSNSSKLDNLLKNIDEAIQNLNTIIVSAAILPDDKLNELLFNLESQLSTIHEQYKVAVLSQHSSFDVGSSSTSNPIVNPPIDEYSRQSQSCTPAITEKSFSFANSPFILLAAVRNAATSTASSVVSTAKGIVRPYFETKDVDPARRTMEAF